jgi:hypothetical protein
MRAGCAETRQPVLNGPADPERDRGRLKVRRLGFRHQHSAHLVEEERIASGPPMHVGGEAWLGLACEDDCHQRSDFRPGQGCQRQEGGSRSAVQEPGQWVVFRQLHV